jgi:hypothetical protein
MTITDPNATPTLGGFQVIHADTSAADDTGTEPYENFFGFETTEKFMLPDGKQWIAFKPMNEGERAIYETQTQKDVTVNRRTDEAKIKMSVSNDRHALLIQSVCDWNLMQRQPSGEWMRMSFSKGAGGTFAQWLSKANPKIVNALHQAIVNANEWMVAELTAEAIREEIASLQEKLVEAEKREALQKNS